MTTDMEPKYPDITVTLTGEDGNAMFILGRVRKAMKQHDVPKTEIDQFTQEATSGDYEHLLITVMKWVDTE